MTRRDAQLNILAIDSRLIVAGERLARYRVTGPDTSVTVQRGVVNRLLDQRLVLMDERDRHLPKEKSA